MPARDIDVRGVAWSGAAIAAAILVVVGAVLLLLRLWHVAPGPDRVRTPYDLVIEGPALQSAPQPDLRDERASKARILATSAWVDDANGIVRIPIATAMRLLVERSGEGAGGPASAAASTPTVAPDVTSSPPPPEAASSAAGAPR